MLEARYRCFVVAMSHHTWDGGWEREGKERSLGKWVGVDTLEVSSIEFVSLRPLGGNQCLKINNRSVSLRVYAVT